MAFAFPLEMTFDVFCLTPSQSTNSNNREAKETLLEENNPIPGSCKRNRREHRGRFLGMGEWEGGEEGEDSPRLGSKGRSEGLPLLKGPRRSLQEGQELLGLLQGHLGYLL